MEFTPFVFLSWEDLGALSTAEAKKAYLIIQKEFFSTKQRLQLLETSQNTMLTEIKEMKRQISQISVNPQQQNPDIAHPGEVVPPPLDEHATFEQKLFYYMRKYDKEKEMRIREEEEQQFERQEKERKKNNFVIYEIPWIKDNIQSEYSVHDTGRSPS